MRVGYLNEFQIAREVADPLAGGGLNAPGDGTIERDELTGDVTAAAGSNTTAIAADAVDNTKLDDMAEATFKGRASGAGAGDPTDLTAQQARVILRNACMVRKAADQTAANYTASANVAWDQEVYDDGTWHDNATNNSRLTVPTGITRVRVGARIALANVTASVRILMSILKNGSGVFDGAVAHEGSSPGTSPSFALASGPIPCVATDYFEINLFVATDTSIDVTATASNFWIEAC